MLVRKGFVGTRRDFVLVLECVICCIVCSIVCVRFSMIQED